MRILFVFGSQLLMEGIRTVLEKLFVNSSYVLVTSKNELEKQLAATNWDLLVVEVDNPVFDAESILLRANELLPAIKTIFVCDHADRRVLQAYRKGLKGSFSKFDSKEGVELAFKTVVSGQIYVPQSVILNVICDGHVFTDLEHQLTLLTEKEKSLLSHLCSGKRMKEITQLMKLAPSTLSTHKHRIIRKMGITSAQEFNSFLKVYAETIAVNKKDQTK